ncbi:hypothetical protein ACFWYW_57515 [Nonomuraea sp. NPDC059023]|uniref:hypothetical protein n=1 Tax=unclassified Nonomuraea TaxID=2593643 RepID=UPI0036AFA2FF
MTYTTPARGHDAEWLTHNAMVANDRARKAGVRQGTDTKLRTVPPPRDITPQERARTQGFVIGWSLERHDCRWLTRCRRHRKAWCACRPCPHPDHTVHAREAAELLLMVGVCERSAT